MGYAVKSWVQIPASPHLGLLFPAGPTIKACVTLGKLLNLSEPPFPHFAYGMEPIIPYHRGLSRRLNKITLKIVRAGSSVFLYQVIGFFLLASFFSSLIFLIISSLHTPQKTDNTTSHVTSRPRAVSIICSVEEKRACSYFSRSPVVLHTHILCTLDRLHPPTHINTYTYSFVRFVYLLLSPDIQRSLPGDPRVTHCQSQNKAASHACSPGHLRAHSPRTPRGGDEFSLRELKDLKKRSSFLVNREAESF